MANVSNDDKVEMVLLYNGLSVSVDFLRELHGLLTKLKAESGLRFWEIVYLARHPDYLLPRQTLQYFRNFGLLGSENALHYINQVAILYLVTGQDRTLRVISEEKFQKLISG